MNPQKNAENVQVVHDGEKEGEESRRILADMFLFVGGSKTEIIADRTVYRHDAGDKSFVSLSRMQKRECAFLSSYLCMQDNKPGICRADRQAVFLSNAAMSTTGLCLGILVPVSTASFRRSFLPFLNLLINPFSCLPRQGMGSVCRQCHRLRIRMSSW